MSEESSTPTFVFIDRKHQGHDGKGWSQSKDEGAYEPDLPLDAAARPTEWTGAYVIERLIEAFKTDRYLRLPRPRETGGSHPQTIYTEDDRLGWLERQDADKVIVIGPSKEHFERMEEAFGWLDGYFKIDAVAALALKQYAKMKAFKIGLRKFCADNGCDKTTMPRRAMSVADRIALILSALKTPIT